MLYPTPVGALCRLRYVNETELYLVVVK